MRGPLNRGPLKIPTKEDMIALLGLFPVEPTRAASQFLVYRTTRAVYGWLVPTRSRSLAVAAVGEEAVNPLT